MATFKEKCLKVNQKNWIRPLFVLLIMASASILVISNLFGEDASITASSKIEQKDLSKANDGVEIEGLGLKDMKITTDDTFKYIELKHSAGLKTFKLSDFPLFKLKMTDGTVFDKVKMTEINPGGISAVVTNGAKFIKFADMNQAYQDFFGYDARKAEAYLSKLGKQQANYMKERNEKLKAEAERKKEESRKVELARLQAEQERLEQDIERARAKVKPIVMMEDNSNNSGSSSSSSTVYCPNCAGTGRVNEKIGSVVDATAEIIRRECGYCNGTGKLSQ